jgi:hypothetical protein
VAKVVECLPSKCETLSSNPCTAETKKTNDLTSDEWILYFDLCLWRQWHSWIFTSTKTLFNSHFFQEAPNVYINLRVFSFCEYLQLVFKDIYITNIWILCHRVPTKYLASFMAKITLLIPPWFRMGTGIWWHVYTCVAWTFVDHIDFDIMPAKPIWSFNAS